MAVNLEARVWGPYKELQGIVEAAVTRKQPDAIQDLETTLRKFKPDFLNLLKNPAKNGQHRQAVQQADKNGITIQGQPGTEILSKAFIEEAIIISDLFDLDEYAAVELLIAGETQQPYFPGLTRGLVSVILYYDGRRSLVSTLRLLIQSTRGRTWQPDCTEEVLKMVSQYTDQLLNEGLFSRILDLIRDSDLTQDIERLSKERAIGNPKHRKQIVDMLSDIRQSLAQCLFCWACQKGLGKAEIIKLLAHLRNHSSLGADGTLDGVTQTLLMTLLYAFDVRILEMEDSEEAAKKHQLLTVEGCIQDVHQDVIMQNRWHVPGIKAVVQLAWALTLRALAQYPDNQDYVELCEEDETVITMAIEDNVFQFLQQSVIKAPGLHSEEFHLRQIHLMVSDFLVHFPLKVKELRNRGDEAARIIQAHLQEGIEPPSNIRMDFEHLLNLIGELYSKDPLGLELSLEYWCPSEVMGTPGNVPFSQTFQHFRPPQRQISLYKFVRLAGDLLPPSLYIPYISMLAGLASGPQAAFHCFSMMQTNGGTGGGQVSTVSWDHFFASFNQYFRNLRQEMPVVSDMSHVYRNYPRGITPQEQEGLIVVLHLIKNVATFDQSARITLCENPRWTAIVTFLGLLGCSVSAELKAELLLTLAAFAKSPEVASTIWQSLEVSQIIPTVQTTSTSRSGGLKVELDEVEARNEEYPLTRAFLSLLSSLTDVPVPAALGAGYRSPGFDPYLEFLRESVFLKFTTRAYKNPGEKWEVAAAVLEIFGKLVSAHDVIIEDFSDQMVELPGGGTTAACKPPGHTLLCHMMNDSSMLKMVLYIVDEASKLLERYIDFPGKEHLEQAVLWCLRLIEHTLEKQETFLLSVRESGAALIVSPLDKLLLGINPRSGVADHLVNVAKFVIFNDTNPEHSLSAIRILCFVCQSSIVQPELVGMFTADKLLGEALLHGFVQCLETDDVEDLQFEMDLADEDMQTAQIRSSTRLCIMKLLLHTIDQPAPNLAHLMLGFELNKPVSKTNLQDPGVLGAPRTCLHSVLSLLNRGVSNHSEPSCLGETPRLAELAYCLIYTLCANRETSSPVMRYLRATHDFLYRHLQHLPFVKPGQESVEEYRNLLLNAQMWLLKSVALELRLTAMNRQRSHTQRLVSLLLDDRAAIGAGLSRDITFDMDSHFDIDSTRLNQTQFGQQTLNSGGQRRRKVLSVLDSIGFIQDSPGQVEFEFFDPVMIKQVVKSCTQQTEQGVSHCNVKQLHRILITELNNLQGTAAAGQRPLVLQEIEALLAHIMQRNSSKLALHSKQQAFEAWRQVVEVILTACPEDLLQGEARQNIIFEVLQDLLIKVSDVEALPELTSPVAGVILTLLSNLRHCFLTSNVDIPSHMTSPEYVMLLDAGGAISPTNQSQGFSQGSGSRTLFASSLQVVLKGLVEHVMRSSSGLQRVRANLYGALLYYLQIAQAPEDVQGIYNRVEFEALAKENMVTMGSYGSLFMEVVCRDACDGHDVGRMLAISTLDSILEMDRQQQWLSFLISKGYVQHITESLVQDDIQLQKLLGREPQPLRALYIYESKMGLLTRLAGTTRGAQSLLQCGIMQRLGECSVYDMRPDIERLGQGDLMSFIPTSTARYQQVLFPALKLCLAVLTALGTENREAANKVLQFVVAHVDVFSTVLRDRSLTLNLANLQELMLVTGVISRAAAEDAETDFTVEDPSQIEFFGHLSRIQRLMLALLPRYSMSDALLKQLKSHESGGDTMEIRSKLQLYVAAVSSNVVSYTRKLVSKTGKSGSKCKILFGPSLMEATGTDVYINGDSQTTGGSVAQRMNLGLVVQMLKKDTEHMASILEIHKQYTRKLSSLSQLSTEELKEFCGSVAGVEKMSAQQIQQIAQKKLKAAVTVKTKELQYLSYIVENCLFLVWHHLEFYLLHCVPADHGSSLFQLNLKKQHQLRRLQDTPGSPIHPSVDISMGVEKIGVSATREELEHLKQNAPSCLNDSLFRKLNDIQQAYTKNRTRYSFVEALIRRVQRLLHLHTMPSS